jgi:hypothetical protein
LVCGVRINLYPGLLVLVDIATITPSIHVVVAVIKFSPGISPTLSAVLLPFSVRVINSPDIADFAADGLNGCSISPLLQIEQSWCYDIM